MTILSDLAQGEKFKWESSDDSSDSGETTEEYESQGMKRRKSEEEDRPNKRRKISGNAANPDAWKGECSQLLDTIFQCEDAAPFRTPVDIVAYPNYYEVIDHPMDLGNMRENLDRMTYQDPTEFYKDMRLVFSNSKTYNTNKRSRIYAMTLRLSAMFEERMKEIILNWKSAKRRQKKTTVRFSPRQLRVAPKTRSSAGPSAASSSWQSAGTSGLSMPSSSNRTRGVHSVITNGRHHSSDEDSDTEEEEEIDVVRTTSRSKKHSASAQPKRGLHASLKKNTRQQRPTKKQTNGKVKSESQSGRYSTRASTGTIKRRRYNPEGSVTEENEEEEEEEEGSESDSDTEVEEYPPTRMAQFKKKPTASRNRSSKVSSRRIHSEKSDSSSSSSGSESDSENGADSKSSSSSSSNSSSSTSSSTSSSSSSGTSAETVPSVTKAAATHSTSKVRSNRNTNNKNHVLPRNSSYAYGTTSSNSRNVRHTRFQGKRTIVYHEDSEEDNDSGEEPLSVSSRGRIRKLTPRARASILGE